MKYYPVEQGSGLWYQARLGIPTASNFDRIITPKGEPSKQAAAYRYRLVAERLLRESMDDEIGFVKWVRGGKENEPNAVALYEFMNERRLEPGGFCTSDDGRIGCSPDRLFPGHHEAIEIKCPAPWTLIGYHLDGLGDAYRAQVQGQILVGGFDAVHFFAYHSQMPPYHRVTLPDRGYLGLLSSYLDRFCDELDRDTERARALGPYAYMRRVETPGEVAYQAPEDAQLKIVDPERGEGG
jgi:hypothetical protein